MYYEVDNSYHYKCGHLLSIDELDASDRGKKPVAGQRFGLPGMSAGIGGSSLLAEMKLKKANSAKATAPSPPKVGWL